jgi:hypothetical protein
MGEPVQVEPHPDGFLTACLPSIRRAQSGTCENGPPAGGLSLVKLCAAGGPNGRVRLAGHRPVFRGTW